MNFKSLRLFGALLAVAAVVLTPPVKFGYEAINANRASAVQGTTYAGTARTVVGKCSVDNSKNRRTVTVPVKQVKNILGKDFGFQGVVKVALCTDKNGTVVFGQTTQAKAIDNSSADVSLAIGKPTIVKSKGTTLITRPARATVTTKWNHKYVLGSTVSIKVARVGTVKVSVSNPVLVK